MHTNVSGLPLEDVEIRNLKVETVHIVDVTSAILAAKSQCTHIEIASKFCRNSSLAMKQISR